MKNAMPAMLVMLILIVVAAYFTYQGVSMHEQVAVEEAAFHQLQESYFTQDKATRDVAVTGSELNKDLVDIKNYPSQLLELKLIGIGKILTGIFFLLLGILIALMMMPVRLKQAIKG